MLWFTDISCVACGQAHICITVLSSLSLGYSHTACSVGAEIKVSLLPARSRKGSCWLRGVPLRVGASDGGETVS